MRNKLFILLALVVCMSLLCFVVAGCSQSDEGGSNTETGTSTESGSGSSTESGSGSQTETDLVATKDSLQSSFDSLLSATSYKSYRTGTYSFKLGGSSSTGTGSDTTIFDGKNIYGEVYGYNTYLYYIDDSYYAFTYSSDSGWQQADYYSDNSVYQTYANRLISSMGLSNLAMTSFSNVLVSIVADIDNLMSYDSENGKLVLDQEVTYTFADDSIVSTVTALTYTVSEGSHVLTCSMTEDFTENGTTYTSSITNNTIIFSDVGLATLDIDDDVYTILDIAPLVTAIQQFVIDVDMYQYDTENMTTSGSVSVVDSSGTSILDNATFTSQFAREYSSSNFSIYSVQNDVDMYVWPNMSNSYLMIDGVLYTQQYYTYGDTYIKEQDPSSVATSMYNNFGASLIVPSDTQTMLEVIAFNVQDWILDGTLVYSDGVLYLAEGATISGQYEYGSWSTSYATVDISSFSWQITDNGYKFSITSSYTYSYGQYSYLGSDTYTTTLDCSIYNIGSTDMFTIPSVE